MAQIDYYYSAHSAYAYLGAQALYDICARHGATLVHKPFDLSPVVEAQGSLPFRARTQAHVDYFFGREIERWAEWRGVEIINFRPTYHDTDYSLAGRMIAALGPSGPKVDALSLAILQAHWRDDADLSDIATLQAIASTLGHDPDALITQANSNATRAIYAQNTSDAAANPVFGSPTYIVNGDPFYGQDRLEMLERALTTPFKPTNWTNPQVS
jgi:2-hydroxychromene-2-carboxylate isomerase